MNSQKNRNQSFIYEEEIDHTNREKLIKKIDRNKPSNHRNIR